MILKIINNQRNTVYDEVYGNDGCLTIMNDIVLTMGNSLRCSKALSRRESEVNAQLSVVPLELCLFALLGESQLQRKGIPLFWPRSLSGSHQIPENSDQSVCPPSSCCRHGSLSDDSHRVHKNSDQSVCPHSSSSNCCHGSLSDDSHQIHKNSDQSVCPPFS